MELVRGMVVKELLGDGTFGRVVLAERNGEELAIKVIRDVPRYREDAQIEHQVLQKVQSEAARLGRLEDKGFRRIVR